MISAPYREPLTATEFQALASLLQKSGTGFESSVAGTSMEPAIPHGARIRIRPLKTGEYKEGQIVACIIDNSLFAHRIIYCGRNFRTGAFVLTQGDDWALCDPPTRKSEILGMVTEYSGGGTWHTPADRASRAPWKQVIAGISFWLIRLSLAIHHGFARRVAGSSLALGAVCKKLAAASSKVRLRA